MNLIASGREAEVFDYADGRVLKLFREGWFTDRVPREHAALDALRRSGVRAPIAYEAVEIDGRPGLVMERIDGVDFLTLLEKAPHLIWPSAAVLGRAHAAMHDVVAPASLPLLNDDLVHRITAADALPVEFCGPVLEMLAALPAGDRLCHGDFHPGNVLGSFDSPVVIDWGDASRGDPVADVARTQLLYRFSALPDETPGWLKAVAKVARRIPARRYLRVYRSARPVDGDLLRRWLVVRVAARFYEGIDEEFDTLARFLRRNLRA
jgi:Ser/Thr protein kinase RdoA (MazF antagonist)